MAFAFASSDTQAHDDALAPRVARAVEVRFRDSPYLALRNVGCRYRAGVLTLWGRLPSYYLKQLAQALVVDVDEVRNVVNRIEVVSPTRRPAFDEETPFDDGSPWR